jgi:hypothetical protein
MIEDRCGIEYIGVFHFYGFINEPFAEFEGQ